MGRLDGSVDAFREAFGHVFCILNVSIKYVLWGGVCINVYGDGYGVASSKGCVLRLRWSIWLKGELKTCEKKALFEIASDLAQVGKWICERSFFIFLCLNMPLNLILLRFYVLDFGKFNTVEFQNCPPSISNPFHYGK